MDIWVVSTSLLLQTTLSWRLARIFSGTHLSLEDLRLEVGCRVCTSSPCQTAVQSDCTNLHFLRRSTQVSFVPHPLKHLVLWSFKNFCQSDGHEKKTHSLQSACPIRILMFMDYLNHLSLIFFSAFTRSFDSTTAFPWGLVADSASGLPGFKFWLHHTHLVSEDTLLDLPIPVSSSLKSQEHPPHGVVEGCRACVHKVLITVPGGWGGLDALPPGVPQLLSQIPMTDLPNLRRELQNIWPAVTQLKGMGPPAVNGTSESLATCSFLKSHDLHYLFTWSGVRRTVDSENIPSLLSKSRKQCVRRWETPANLCGTMLLTLHWHPIHMGGGSPKKEMLLTCLCENSDGVAPQARL